MEYNKYIQGKELLSEIFEGMSNDDLIDIYNSYLNEQSIDDFLMEFALANYEDDMLFEAGSVKGPDVKGMVKGLIAGRRVKNGAKKYAKAYLDYKMVDIEEQKVKHGSKWPKLDGPKKKQMEAAWQTAKDEKKEKLSAIEDLMYSVAKSSGSTRVQNMVDPLKAKAKLKGIEQVIKLAKQLYSDSAYAELENTYDNIKADAGEADAKLAKFDKEEKEELKKKEVADAVAAAEKAAAEKDKGNTEVENYKKMGYSITSKKPDAEDWEDIQTLKTAAGNEIYAAIKKTKDKGNTEAKKIADIEKKIKGAETALAAAPDKAKEAIQKNLDQLKADLTKAKETKSESSNMMYTLELIENRLDEIIKNL